LRIGAERSRVEGDVGDSIDRFTLERLGEEVQRVRLEEEKSKLQHDDFEMMVAEECYIDSIRVAEKP